MLLLLLDVVVVVMSGHLHTKSSQEEGGVRAELFKKKEIIFGFYTAPKRPAVFSLTHLKKHFRNQSAWIVVRFQRKLSSLLRPQSEVCGMEATRLSHLFALHLSSTLLTLSSAGLGLKDVPDLLPKAEPPPHPADMAEDTRKAAKTRTRMHTRMLTLYKPLHISCVFFKHVGLVMLMCVILTLEHTQEQTHSWNVDAVTISGLLMTERLLARSFALMPHVRRRRYRG